MSNPLVFFGADKPTARSAIPRKLACAGVILCACAVCTLWPEKMVVWIAGVAFGVALVGLVRP